jgi:hypothetical protein
MLKKKHEFFDDVFDGKILKLILKRGISRA